MALRGDKLIKACLKNGINIKTIRASKVFNSIEFKDEIVLDDGRVILDVQEIIAIYCLTGRLQNIDQIVRLLKLTISKMDQSGAKTGELTSDE